MDPNPTLSELAQKLLADYDARLLGRTQLDFDRLSLNDAYALQTEITRLREERRERVIGYKVGCTSAVIQQQLGIGQPIFGRLFESECFATGCTLAHSAFANLAIEGELAIRVARDIDAAVESDADLWKCIEAIFPVIELHHYILTNRKASASELIVRNGLHAGFIHSDGTQVMRPDERLQVGLNVAINGQQVGTVENAWTMESPIVTLRWLRSQLAEFGLSLKAGHTILTGSPLRLFEVQPRSDICVAAPGMNTCRARIET